MKEFAEFVGFTIIACLALYSAMMAIITFPN
jgi:hypothetical protein